MKTRRRVRRVPYLAPAPYGLEVMTLAQLRAMAPGVDGGRPERPEFHLLILATAGHTTHRVDFEEHEIDAGECIWVRPGQVQRFDPDGTGSADLVLMQPDFLIPGTLAARIADDRFAAVHYDAPASSRAMVTQARRAVRSEYHAALASPGGVDPVRAESLRHLMSALILRLAAGGIAGDRSPRQPRQGLHDRFRDLLEQEFTTARDVDHYARRLGYSTRTLARATGSAAGLTPKEMIAERVALEAARRLAHSDDAITTIAASLGFRDPSNFSTFFVTRMKMTPTAFRAAQRR